MRVTSDPPILLVSPNRETYPMPVYPVALPRLAGALQLAGHGSLQVDVQVHGTDGLVDAIQRETPLCIGLSMRNIDATSPIDEQVYVPDMVPVMAAIRQYTDAPVVLGGSGFSLFPSQLMATLGADYGIVGPGELGLATLATALAAGDEPRDIPGLVGVASGTSPPAHHTPIGAMVHAPSIIEHYWRTGRAIGVQLKRGCTAACSYCTYPQLDGRRLIWAEVGALVDDMERLYHDHGVSYFFITDSLFNLDAEQEQAFARELAARGLPIDWGAFFAPTRMTRDYIDQLVASGLRHIEFGTDALSDTMLESYNKQFRVADVMAVAEVCVAAGVRCAHYLIFGGPGESDGTIEETVTNALRLRRSVFFVFAGVRIYPGTALRADAVSREVIASDDDLFQPRYYLEPGLTAPSIVGQVRGLSGAPRNWVFPGDHATLEQGMAQLRGMGATGPLWDFLIDPFS